MEEDVLVGSDVPGVTHVALQCQAAYIIYVAGPGHPTPDVDVRHGVRLGRDTAREQYCDQTSPYPDISSALNGPHGTETFAKN